MPFPLEKTITAFFSFFLKNAVTFLIIYGILT